MYKKAELVSNYFATIYLTFISLLQSVALSQLVPIIITYFEKSEHPMMDIQILPLALMLFIIFIVWHHYAIGIFYLRWFPNIIDTIIPFVVSIGQFFLVSYLTINTSVSDINMDRWTLGFAIFLIVGSFAYFAAAWRIEADLFLNIMSKSNADTHCQYIRKYYNLAGFSILGQGLFAFIIVYAHNNEWLLVSLILFLSHLILSEYFLMRTFKPHFVLAIDEFDGNAE
ncbi:MAG: hypothetical protein ABJB16_02925 [Saprospiraceae bacterium]